MKILFSIILTIHLSFEVDCQAITLDCILLQKSLENDFFNKYFLIDKFPNETIVVIDTSNLFHSCTLNDVHNRKVEIRHELSTKMNKHEIIVNCVFKEGRKTILAFFHPISHVYLELELNKKMRKIKVKVKSGGVF